MPELTPQRHAKKDHKFCTRQIWGMKEGGNVAEPQKIKRPRKFVWQRDVRMVIHPGIYRYSATEAAQDNNIYILPRIGPTCAIIPRGLFAHDHETFARYIERLY